MSSGNLAGMGGWGGSKPTTPKGGTPAGGTPLGGSTPVMGSPQHRPQAPGAWQGHVPGDYFHLCPSVMHLLVHIFIYA